jgi:hypothetical protein
MLNCAQLPLASAYPAAAAAAAAVGPQRPPAVSVGVRQQPNGRYKLHQQLTYDQHEPVYRY